MGLARLQSVSLKFAHGSGAPATRELGATGKAI